MRIRDLRGGIIGFQGRGKQSSRQQRFGQKTQASKVQLVAGGSLASCNQCFCFWRFSQPDWRRKKKEEKRPSVVVVAATYKLLMEKKWAQNQSPHYEENKFEW